MSISVTDLRNIALAGGGMVLNASDFSVTDLRNIALAAKSKQAQITLKNTNKLSTTDLRNIALAGGGCVVLDFT